MAGDTIKTIVLIGLVLITGCSIVPSDPSKTPTVLICVLANCEIEIPEKTKHENN